MDAKEMKDTCDHLPTIPRNMSNAVDLTHMEENRGLQCTSSKENVQLSISSVSENLIMRMKLEWNDGEYENKTKLDTMEHYTSSSTSVQIEKVSVRHNDKNEESGLMIDIGDLGRIVNIEQNENDTIYKNDFERRSTRDMTKLEIPEVIEEECNREKSDLPFHNTDNDSNNLSENKLKIKSESSITYGEPGNFNQEIPTNLSFHNTNNDSNNLSEKRLKIKSESNIRYGVPRHVKQENRTNQVGLLSQIKSGTHTSKRNICKLNELLDSGYLYEGDDKEMASCIWSMVHEDEDEKQKKMKITNSRKPTETEKNDNSLALDHTLSSSQVLKKETFITESRRKDKNKNTGSNIGWLRKKTENLPKEKNVFKDSEQMAILEDNLNFSSQNILIQTSSIKQEVEENIKEIVESQDDLTLEVQFQNKSRYSLRNVIKPTTYAESSGSEQIEDDDDDTSDDNYEENTDDYDIKDERMGINYESVKHRRNIKKSGLVPVSDLLNIMRSTHKTNPNQDINSQGMDDQCKSSSSLKQDRHQRSIQNQERISETGEKSVMRVSRGKRLRFERKDMSEYFTNLEKLAKAGKLEDKWRYMYGEEDTFTNLNKTRTCTIWQLCVYDDSEAFRKCFDYVEWNCFMKCIICDKVFEKFANFLRHCFFGTNCCKQICIKQKHKMKQCPPCKKIHLKTRAFVRHMLQIKSHGTAGCAYVPKPQFLENGKYIRKLSVESNSIMTCTEPNQEISADGGKATDTSDLNSSSSTEREKTVKLKDENSAKSRLHIDSQQSVKSDAYWLNTFEPGYQCKLCPGHSNVFLSLHRAIQHIKRHHTYEDNNELCYRKKVSYNRKGEEKVCIRRLQNDSDGYLCSICGQSFRQRQTYHAHVVTVHKDVPAKDLGIRDEQNVCSYCGKSFSVHRYTEYKRHLLTHTGPVQCDKCNNILRSQAAYIRHRDVHREIAYTCKECGKIYHSKPNFDQHLKNHQLSMLSSSERKFKCETCDKTFMKKDHLRKHLTVHSDIRPFSCDDCGAKFKSKYHVKRHLEKSCPKKKKNKTKC